MSNFDCYIFSSFSFFVHFCIYFVHSTRLFSSSLYFLEIKMSAKIRRYDFIKVLGEGQVE
jgi:hypothetical protein